jgi:hypothetical protein
MAKRKMKRNRASAGAELPPRCGRNVPNLPAAADGSQWKCVRPARHRGICAIRSADLESLRPSVASALETHMRTDVAAFLQRGQAAQRAIDELTAGVRGAVAAAAIGGRLGRASAPAEDFAACAVELGLPRAAALLARMRAAAAEL